MNSFSLRPRLLILLHKGRQLESLLKMTSQVVPVQFLAPIPLVDSAPSSYTVLSGTALKIPEVLLPAAEVTIDCTPLLSDLSLENDKRYELPEIQLQFFSTGDTEPILFTIESTNVKTFSTGKPLKQVLAFWAALLNCELDCYGWKTTVKGNTLHIEASLERVGWNICGAFMSTSLLDFDSRDKASAKVVKCHWGPYQIGSDIFSMDFSLLPTWNKNDLKSCFENSLREQKFPYAWKWKNDFFSFEVPAQTPLKKIDTLLDRSGSFEVLPLILTLQHEGASELSFQLNHKKYVLDTTLPSSRWVAVLSQQHVSEPITISITEDQKLLFQADSLSTELVFSDVSSVAQRMLGLSELEIPAANTSFLQASTTWSEVITLLNQFQPLLKESDVLQDLIHGFLTTVPDSLEQISPDEITDILACLSQMLMRMENWMNTSESNTSTTHFSQNLRPTKIPTAPSDSKSIFDSSEKKQHKPRVSQFDHKI